MHSRSRGVVGSSCLSVCLMLASGSVWAQAAGASAPAPATAGAGAAVVDSKAQLSDVERAKRDADKVFQWIKFHAEKGETKKPEKHEVKAESKPEARPEPKAEPRMQPVVAKSPAAAPVKRSEPEDSRSVASAAPIDSSPTAPPAYTGRIPEVMAMAAPATTPAAGTPAAPAQQPEPEPASLPEEDAPLRLVSKVDPEYPRALLSQQRNGSVTVKFVVQPDGSVNAVEAIKSPDRKLSAAAVTAVKQWRFAPVNKPRPVSVEIGFQME